MNRRLKARIIERFGHQMEFAKAVGAREDAVSRVIYGRNSLSPERQREWAKILECKPEDLFPDDMEG